MLSAVLYLLCTLTRLFGAFVNALLGRFLYLVRRLLCCLLGRASRVLGILLRALI